MINKNEAIKNNIKVIDNSIKNELFENLKTNFPQTIIEGKADLKAISLLLGLDKKSDISGYELTWTGKGLSNALYSSPCNKELKLEEIFSNADCKNLNSSNIEMKDSNNPKNIIIRGDNLDVLKILKSAYSEKIKMIYIDPPYNTTNENFIYPDNFRQDYKKILEEVGLIEIDENGQEVESEDLKFFKNIQGSRTHSGWLSFMLPRLKLARDLLKEDGVIFISIDDNEQANLKLLCDEIFGEDNFICNFIWQRTKTPARLSKNISKTHEFILVYARDNDKFSMNKMPLNDMYIKKTYKNPDNDPRGKWRTAPLLGTASSSNKKATYTLPDGRKITGKWRCSEETLKRYVEENRLVYCENGAPNKKIFLSENEGQTINSILLDSGTNDNATEELKILFESAIFDFPKPINLIKTLLQISTTPNSNDIILDFFAGSGTTAQAVMELNAEDKGNREFILVQIDEEIKEDKSKSAYDFCKKELKSENPVISDITIERVKRAAQKIIQSSKDNDLNLGFKVFTLEDKPEIIIDKDKNLKLINRRNLSVIDKVVNMFLISGKTLDKKIENIFDGKLYKCEDSFYLISFNKEILKYLIKTQNEYIFIDAYGDIELEDFLNLDAGFKERLKVVY
ncbi:site-specific DNA-methyltransferase [Brachyspira aalborgi]|uniref:site-specific DNA-methyltransferase n=1 Tax=Brachyspira aalborgi TaxID=29522 RepID=UPI0011CBE609|nr:site-specific DNA-methyltransferase [Brachyspira aalborgi]TXJ16171.1 site-specific DNA-methyltransferase [Brachyspira aalborgi]TXJ21802.1 site-specific DNA-methyltransferase [Brachyspira aalborgi]